MWKIIKVIKQYITYDMIKLSEYIGKYSKLSEHFNWTYFPIPLLSRQEPIDPAVTTRSWPVHVVEPL